MNRQKQQYDFNKLQKRLRRHVGEAIVDYGMIEENDRIMVCLSGGKDSYTLLDMLLSLQRSAPVAFSLVAVNLDQKQPGFPQHVLPTWLQSKGIEYKIIEQDTYTIVQEKIPQGKTTCSLCSRLRRAILYRCASELNCTKVALGHHRDDLLQTLFLNLFYGGKMKAMPPKLKSDDGKHIVIRPLAYCREKDIQRYADARQFPIIPCNLCGSQPNLQRQVIADMLRDWDKRYPGRLETLFSALKNVSAEAAYCLHIKQPLHIISGEVSRFVFSLKGVFMVISFSNLWNAHPEVKGDAIPCRLKNGRKAFDDQCAIRVGTALARCGFDVTKLRANFCWHHPKDQGHILRAEELAIALAATPLPGISSVVKINIDNFEKTLKNKTGIIFFKDYWRRGNESFLNRSGDHIDLWNGSRLTTRLSYFRIQWGLSIERYWSSFSNAKEIWFWRVI